MTQRRSRLPPLLRQFALLEGWQAQEVPLWSPVVQKDEQNSPRQP